MYTPMIKQYLTIKAKHEDAFLFFRLGDFYELFFSDAERAAEILEITLTSRGGGEEKVPMCGVPFHSATPYIIRLVDKGFKVAICEQTEDPAQAKGIVRREVVKIITPGTMTEIEDSQGKNNNYLLTITAVDTMFALSAVDVSTGDWHITKTDSIEAWLQEATAYSSREVLIDQELIEYSEKITTRLKTSLTPFSLENATKLQMEISKQIPNFCDTCPNMLLKRVVLLTYAYLQETQKCTLPYLNQLNYYNDKQYMILDDTARKTLELNQTFAEGKKEGTLYWLLNQTETAMGARLLQRWIDKPLFDREEILSRQEIVQAFVNNALIREELRDSLKNFYDLERLAVKVSSEIANAKDLTRIKRSLEIIPTIDNSLRNLAEPSLIALADELENCQDICDTIKQAITDDSFANEKDGEIIKTGYSSELDQLWLIQKNGYQLMAELEQKEREKTGIKSLKIGYNRVFGYYLEVTKTNIRHVSERYMRKQTLANAERFVTEELLELQQKILQAGEEADQLEQKYFLHIRKQIAKHVQRLQSLSRNIAKLDTLIAFASVAVRFKYCRPIIHKKDHLLLRAARHPMIEAMNKREQFIANDIELDKATRQVLLITGPNMAGKSTYMRQTALISIMAQIGSFVPASEAELPLLDRIFTRIGAADDVVGGRSTFMVEMTETRFALTEATENSLIILDEVGRGTSTIDGLALAKSIVEYIHEHIGAKTLFSTHYHELTVLEKDWPRVQNVHAQCIEREGKVIFLHRIVAGGTDRSYGLYVAELAGIPAKIITRAHEHIKNLGYKESAHTLPTQQLDLFTCPKCEKEAAVAQALQQWDILNKTPYETMQFLLELQCRLQREKV